MVREERYIVFKISDIINTLSDDEKEVLIQLGEKIDQYRTTTGKSKFKCVVVESDWPEYEQTWNAIEKRVDNKRIIL